MSAPEKDMIVPDQRITIEQDFGELRIVVPPKTMSRKDFFGPILTVPILVYIWFSSKGLSDHRIIKPSEHIFLFSFAAIVGMMVLNFLLGAMWTLTGKTVITLNNGTLAVRRSVLGFGLTKRFDSTRIRDLRLEEPCNEYKTSLPIMKFTYGKGRFAPEPWITNDANAGEGGMILEALSKAGLHVLYIRPPKRPESG